MQTAAWYKERSKAQDLVDFGDAAFERADYEMAEWANDEALAIYRQIGDALGEADCVFRRSWSVSDYATALRAVDEALVLYRQFKNANSRPDGTPTLTGWHREATCIFRRSWIAFLHRDYATAQRASAEALTLYRRIEYSSFGLNGIINCFVLRAKIALRRGLYKAGERAYDGAQRAYYNLRTLCAGFPLDEAECTNRIEKLDILRKKLREGVPVSEHQDAAIIPFSPIFQIGESNKSDYIDIRPSPEAADTTARLRMQDDLSKNLANAKAKVKADAAAARLSAAYEVLVRHCDLLNPALAEGERLRRAERLLKTYKRLRQAKPNFRDDANPQLRAARRISSKRQYQRDQERKARPTKLAM